MIEQKRFRVAVVVFGEMEAYDQSDAESGLMLAVRQLISQRMGLPQTISGSGAGGPFDVDIHDVIGLGMAAGNGYVWSTVTNKAYPPAHSED